jgi:cysteinyl-tRNA synthetase
MADAARLVATFDDAIASREVQGAVNAILELDRTLVAWEADTLQSDEPERVRTMLRSLIVRLGDVAATGARDPREVVAPFVDALLAVRASARATRDFATADVVRDRLIAAGVEVRDTADDVTWVLRSP